MNVAYCELIAALGSGGIGHRDEFAGGEPTLHVGDYVEQLGLGFGAEHRYARVAEIREPLEEAAYGQMAAYV